MDNEENAKNNGWWRTADLGECPITLECFSTLGYPPFALYHPGKTPTDDSTDGVSAYFDGLALASYIVSRGVFQNPLTRVEMTAEDCRRLDRYLEAHCYRGDAVSAATIFRGSRVISVAEAFALRNSVSVETTAIQSNNERDRERIRTLQNAATAALAGLFVYGNDRFDNNETAQSVPRYRAEDDALLNDWGFDLFRQLEDTSAQDTHGYAVIDDDEEVAVASRRQAYENVQEAFPRLTSHEPTVVSPDEELMERIRTLSTRDENEQRLHALRLERAREQLLKQALERRKQRQKDRLDRLARDKKTYASQKKDEEELERARREIEAWRDDQWEKLRLLSEEKQRKQKELQNTLLQNPSSKDHKSKPTEDVDIKFKAVDNPEATIRDTTDEERKKAKAAAKRKRAKERKKAKKALEKKEAEQIRLKEVDQARKAASALKCAACGTGILKRSLAFERFDQLFCTPKCARTAVKQVAG